MRRSWRNKAAGFSLIELMVVVAIIGILAAIAIPAFVGYTRRAKTSEAGSNLKNMFTAAAGYYQNENWATRTLARTGSVAASACTVTSATTTNVPSANKTPLNFQTTEPASFRAIGFSIADPVYYRYGIISAAASCGHAGGEDLYSFQAVGDLNSNGTTSLFEIQAGSNGDNELMRSPGIYRQNELE